MTRTDNMDQHLDGGCSCGAVRYRLTTPPMYVHCCHCSWCQRESGAAFALNAIIESDRVALLQGTPQRVDLPSASGDGQKMFRCATCQIALWSNYVTAVGDKVRFVRVGTLDTPDRLPPDIHIFTSTKQPWLALSGDVPEFAEFYDRADLWSADSLQRFNALAD